MKFILTSVSVGMVVASFLVNNLTRIIRVSQNVNKEVAEVKVLAAHATASTTTTDSVAATPVPSPVATAAATATPQPTNEFYYSNSKIIEQEDGRIVMEITGDPDQITNWYEDLLKSFDMQVNSNIRTKTNGQVNNKLVSSGGARTIEVNITKYADSQIVFINVSY